MEQKSMYDALVNLWNAVYQDKSLGEAQHAWYESGANPVTVEMICRGLPLQLQLAMVDAYNAIHANHQKTD
jgi:hypothetical protein